MNGKDYLFYMLPRLARYKLAYHNLRRPIGPMVLTFSVTNLCQSRCQSCNIWDIYKQRPGLWKQELQLSEIERTFKSIGQIYFFNVSGGEPFLRKDLPEIIELALVYMKPRIVHIPTNAISPLRVEEGVAKILEYMHKHGANRVPLTVKPSLDGVGEVHDRVRGVPGNFEKVVETVEALKRLRQRYPNLHVELGTVVSRMNLAHVKETADFVHQWEGIESYRNEIAEQRTEFFNIGDPITPSGEEYDELMEYFSARTRENIRKKRRLARITESLRLVYYEYAGRIVKEKRQVLPCYGGITNAHLNPYGQVWPCAVLGYDQPMGNVRDFNYDFQALWNSEQAKQVRAYIKAGKCACPLANQSYSNILMDPVATAKVAYNVMFFDGPLGSSSSHQEFGGHVEQAHSSSVPAASDGQR
jgi:MoaA/NifB/PqqE/SkfB family radical SAM enzyme